MTPDLNVSVPDEAVERLIERFDKAAQTWRMRLADSTPMHTSRKVAEQEYIEAKAALAAGYPSMVAEVERLKRCISMAMGCINPDATDRDLRLAWFRLADALDGREPRASLKTDAGEAP